MAGLLHSTTRTTQRGQPSVTPWHVTSIWLPFRDPTVSIVCTLFSYRMGLSADSARPLSCTGASQRVCSDAQLGLYCCMDC